MDRKAIGVRRQAQLPILYIAYVQIRVLSAKAVFYDIGTYIDSKDC